MTLSFVAFAAMVSLACGTSHGRGYGGYSPYHPSPAPAADVLDEGDKLNARLASVSARLNFQQERFASLNQRLSLQRKFLDTFTKVYLAQVKANDEVQDSSILLIQQEADSTAYDLLDLTKALDELEAANVEGTDAQVELSDAIARANKINVRQNAQITLLHVKISGLKNKLLQVLNNVLQVFLNKVGATETVLSGATETEKRRMCETGRVVFDGPGTQEHSFQSPFDGVPSVTMGLCDFRYNVNARPPVSQGYGYGPQITQPNSLGNNILYYATENAVIVNGIDESFGDTRGIGGELCYTACSITPNIFYPVPSGH